MNNKRRRINTTRREMDGLSNKIDYRLSVCVCSSSLLLAIEGSIVVLSVCYEYERKREWMSFRHAIEKAMIWDIIKYIPYILPKY